MKKCTKCGRWLVANTVNFYRRKRSKDGLKSECKECANKQKKQYREANKDKIAEYSKQWYETNKDKIAEQKKQYREANKDKIAKKNKRWYEANKDKITEQQKQWREANKEKIAEYYQDNRDKVLEQQKQYREANKNKIAERHKQYYQSPKGQVVRFNSNQRRRIKEEQQGTGITKDQWLEMMSFFDWRCAYSGETLTKKTRSIDHIVPLNREGEHEIWNMVPMTRSLNSSKRDKDILKWYKDQDFYSEARLAKIYKWQEYARKKWKK